MNEKQKKVLIGVMAVVAMMLLCPPFYWRAPAGNTFNLGYGLILNPPVREGFGVGTVDISLLVTQWAAVLLVGAIAFFLFKDKN